MPTNYFWYLIIIILLLISILALMKCLLNKKKDPAPIWHAKLFINFSNHTLNKKGDIMEGNSKVDQRGLLVFGGPKDKYKNPTTLNGDGVFSSSDEEIATITKATQADIDEYNNDLATPEADKILPAEFPYVGAWKSNSKVGAALLKLIGDPSTADDDTPIESSFTLNVGAGAASNFGTVRLVGTRDDEDDN